MNNSQTSQHAQTTRISDKLWHCLVPQENVIQTTTLQLTTDQSTKLIQSETLCDIKNILSQQQKQAVSNALGKSQTKTLYAKVNGRVAKDLPSINQQIHKLQDLLQILHSSEFILENIHKNTATQIVLKQFIPQLTKNNKIFDVYVRSGFSIAIGQKICDHIEEQPTQKQIQTIINLAQTINPAITLVAKGKQLNAFLLSVYCKQNLAKIISIRKYPPFPESPSKIFTNEQLQKYYKQIQQQNLHRSEDEKYFYNQGIVPLIKMIKKQEDIKQSDMSQYLMGNQIDDKQKLNEWKQFMKEANEKLAQ